MAERVQRFIWDNKILEATTVMSATSQQESAPVGFLLDPLRTKGWRSKIGWTVVAGFNDKLDFLEGASARVATIAPGTYPTYAAMATAVQSAMNTAPSVTNTYTVTVSIGGAGFTILRTSGGASVSLQFATGANLASSVHPDIGFTDTDLSGLTTYSSDIDVYQSRQAILVDLGASGSSFEMTATAVIVSDPGSVTSVKVQGSSSTFVGVAAGASPSFSVNLTSGEALRVSFFSAEFRRYWRLVIDATASDAGYTEVGVWSIGTYFQPSRSYLQGNTQRAEMLTTQSRGDQGAIYRNPKNAPKRLSCVFRNLPTEDRDSWVEMEDASIGIHIFFVTDALNSPEENTYYGVIEESVELSQSIGDGTPPDRYSFRLGFLEDLG